MSGFRHPVVTLLSFSACLLISGPALAQAIDANATPGPAAQDIPSAQTAPAAEPTAAEPSAATEQTAQGAPRDLGQGTKAEAEHSAEATAHKSLNDPNNQLGTSLQGRTRPIVDADAGAPKDTAAPASTPDAAAPDAAPQVAPTPEAPAPAAQ